MKRDGARVDHREPLTRLGGGGRNYRLIGYAHGTVIRLPPQQVDSDQVGHVLRPRPLGHLGRGAGLHEPPVLHHDQAIG